MSRWRAQARWLGLPLPARLVTTAAHALLAGLAVWSASVQGVDARDWQVLGFAVACAAFNVEWGRLAEGGRRSGQRPHKGLSAWPLAAALLAPIWVCAAATVVIYSHARWRGMRVQLWKWLGSGTFVALAAVVATSGGSDVLVHGAGPRELLVAALTVGLFVLVEGALFAAVAWTNAAEDEVWLRAQLRSAGFYATEAGVGCCGLLTAVVWARSPWLVGLVVPIFPLLQQAVLFEPLWRASRSDAKTGLLNFQSWRDQAEVLVSSSLESESSVCLLMLDLDKFKELNDSCGHLAGDEALSTVVEALRAACRSGDLLGRFGGDEFCAVLPGLSLRAAQEAAERLRKAVQQTRFAGPVLTVSIGGCVIGPVASDAELGRALAVADAALYRAKAEGRNRSLVLAYEATMPIPHPRSPYADPHVGAVRFAD